MRALCDLKFHKPAGESINKWTDFFQMLQKCQDFGKLSA